MVLYADSKEVLESKYKTFEEKLEKEEKELLRRIQTLRKELKALKEESAQELDRPKKSEKSTQIIEEEKEKTGEIRSKSEILKELKLYLLQLEKITEELKKLK